jgi:hypothetical protein
MLNDRTDDELRARVFISCGQNKSSDEPALALEISTRLTALGFDPYVAVGEQSLRGLKENIFEQLDRSEYFVFIDFKRERMNGTDQHRGSLFSHQELAVASYLNIDVLAFREQGVKPNDGILGFIQGNAIPFHEREKLPELVARHVSERMRDGSWNPRWRNELVLERKQGQFLDVANSTGYMHRYFQVGVRNRHHRRTAMNCYAYLEKVILLDTGAEVPLKIFELKWEGYMQPNAHVRASAVRSFDAFCIRHDVPSELKFYGPCDASYLFPRIGEPGRYQLTYSVVADNFPPARRLFVLSLNSSLASTTLDP